jgi:hypothetical protein
MRELLTNGLFAALGDQFGSGAPERFDLARQVQNSDNSNAGPRPRSLGRFKVDR